MAAEITGVAVVDTPAYPGFNEAAANGRGNHQHAVGGGSPNPASMRPRRMAAEISGRTPRTRAPTRFNEAAANGRGNPLSYSRAGVVMPRFNEAAANGRGNRRVVRHAEGRPHGFNEAAANGRGNPSRRRSPSASAHFRFNEAAANGRGNLPGDAAVGHRHRASMRPRRMAAEITTFTRGASPTWRRFNEAAANGRGNPASIVAVSPPSWRLQ